VEHENQSPHDQATFAILSLVPVLPAWDSLLLQRLFRDRLPEWNRKPTLTDRNRMLELDAQFRTGQMADSDRPD
jgi:hypothetical protein